MVQVRRNRTRAQMSRLSLLLKDKQIRIILLSFLTVLSLFFTIIIRSMIGSQENDYHIMYDPSKYEHMVLPNSNQHNDDKLSQTLHQIRAQKVGIRMHQQVGMHRQGQHDQHRHPNSRYDKIDIKMPQEWKDKLLKRQNTQMRNLPHHCTSPSPIQEIIVKGERHTGTNWIRHILAQNLPQTMRIPQDSSEFGWKHGFLPPLGWGRPLDDPQMVVVVTRDVFTWLQKMKKQTYDPYMDPWTKKKISMARFLRVGYGAFCQPTPKRTENPIQLEFCNTFVKNKGWFGGWQKEYLISETAENVIQIRTQKYKQWLSDDLSDETVKGSKEDFRKNRLHLRLESLTFSDEGEGGEGHDIVNVEEDETNQWKVIGKPLLDRCIPVAEYFQAVVTHTKFDDNLTQGQRLGTKFDAARERMLLLRRYSKEDLRYILSQLDMEFEKKLGYNYDYVYDMLKE